MYNCTPTVHCTIALHTFCERSVCLSISQKQLKFKLKRQSKQLNSNGPIPLYHPKVINSFTYICLTLRLNIKL